MSRLGDSHLTVFNSFHRVMLTFLTVRLKESQEVALPGSRLDLEDSKGLGKATAYMMGAKMSRLCASYVDASATG